MNYRIKIIVLITVLFLWKANASCQSFESNTYKNAIGIRARETSGLTFKHNKDNSAAFEGILGIWSNGLSLTGLFEKHAPAFDVLSMRWYYGIGGHIAVQTHNYYFEGRRFSRGDKLGLGIDGLVGLEYKIPPIPFAIDVNVKPFLEVNTNGDVFLAIDPGLGVKFAF